MDRSELEELLGDISRVRVAVLGDYCLDVYWFEGDSAREVSLETGLETRPVREQRYSLGGAANVAANLAAMGVKDVRSFGVVGSDPWGAEMTRLLRKKRIDADRLLVQEGNWDTHVYVKPHVGDREQQRFDLGALNRVRDEIASELLRGLEASLPTLDLVIVNEQASSGIHRSGHFRRDLNDLMRRHPGFVFLLDSRRFSDEYEGVLRKINDHEAARLCGMEPRSPAPIPLDEARLAAEALHRRWNRPVIVTRGPGGCLVAVDGSIHEIPGVPFVGPVDPVGAGDSMLAGIAAGVAAGRDLVTAATLGSFVAGVTVRKLLQTGTASPDEILALAAATQT